MPLPKMPTRPATVLPVPDKAPAVRRTRRTQKETAAVTAAEPTEPTQLQPALNGLEATPPAPSRTARPAPRKTAKAALLTPAPDAPELAPGAASTDTTAMLDDTTAELAVRRPTAAERGRAAAGKPVVDKHIGSAKLFVLDTNVLMHDPTSLFRF